MTATAGARPRLALDRDDGAGSVLALVLVAAVVTLSLTMVGLGAGLAARQRVVGAADAAALAAADAASGAVTGEPCARAAQLAAANGTELEDCEVEDATATVQVGVAFGPVPLLARARAGPAGAR